MNGAFAFQILSKLAAAASGGSEVPGASENKSVTAVSIGSKFGFEEIVLISSKPVYG